MVLCSVEDVRAYVNPKSVSDADINAIIQRVSTEVMTKAEATDESNAFLIQAGIHGAAAVTLDQAIINGELAASVETPEYKQQNPGFIDMVNSHKKEMANYIQMYRDSIRAANFAIPYARVGIGTVNAELQ
jgi:hypothetical protein